jgi:putative SOS response-associated peptidase YedK
MCATYQLSFDDLAEIKKIADEITHKYGGEAANRTFGNDFYPKSEAPVIGKRNQVVMLKWGFPTKDTKKIIFNARAESLTEKNLYKGILSNRCLVPATAFYEWSGDKTKYRISVGGASLFYMAALWKAEILNDNQKAYYYTIITTEPNRQMKEIHSRMPAIIAPENSQIWLNDESAAFRLLRPYEAEMKLTAV